MFDNFSACSYFILFQPPPQFEDIEGVFLCFKTKANNDGEASDIAPKNRLRKVTESSLTTKGFKRQGAGGDYTYDANGNLKTDPNEGITLIEYNHLNLPTKVTFNTGSTIEWLYDASGRKLRKTAIAASSTIGVNGQPIAPGTYISTGLLTSTGTVSAGTTVTLKGKLGVELLPNFEAQSGSNFEAVQDATIVGDIQDYVDGIEYKNGTFEAIYHAEGRVTTINGSLKYEYALRDHLGNTRLMFCDKTGPQGVPDGVITQSLSGETSEVTQEQHFYPFGMAMEGTWSNTPSVSDNKYQFGGKELNSDFGLDWMDFGARMYDAALGRWSTIDPMAEKYAPLSPYNYTLNNPIRFIDPDGMSVRNDDGSVTFQGFAGVDENGNVSGTTLGSSGEKKGSNGQANGGNNKQNRTKVSVNGVVLSDRADDENQSSTGGNTKFTIYYTNDTKGLLSSYKELTKKQASDAIKEAMFILSQALGSESFVSQEVGVDFAKKHAETKENEFFIALVNHGNVLPGLTSSNGSKTTGVHNGNYWSTYANAFHAKGNTYKLGYFIAHEILHQLQAYSGYGGVHDYNKPYNLNTPGTDAMPFIPNSRNNSSTPRPIETIPNYQLPYIKKYLGL